MAPRRRVAPRFALSLAVRGVPVWPCHSHSSPLIRCARPNQTRRPVAGRALTFPRNVPPPETWDPVVCSAREPAAAGPPAGHLVVPGRLLFVTESTSSRTQAALTFGRTAPAGGGPRRCRARLARHTERETQPIPRHGTARPKSPVPCNNSASAAHRCSPPKHSGRVVASQKPVSLHLHTSLSLHAAYRYLSTTTAAA